ncbi:hypothetical protein HJD18_12525 [Thermoleophilia bacterium SCSIO 60948]|nr:hypothetical protein HJD18_12525 [Thermoleophilia bacterium SCSIO 60948]
MVMNRHLNAFRAYSGSPGHEDQLTRAAMIVMRTVPPACDAFLRRVRADPLAQLPGLEVDMQTSHVFAADHRAAAAQGEVEGPLVDELLSVFLSPDEDVDLSSSEIVEREGEGQRLDGVLRFGSRLVIAVESKIFEGRETKQVTHLGLEGVQPASSRAEGLSWHRLLEDWWNLSETGRLGPAETALITDFFDFGEDHFPDLLPFTSLRRAGDNAKRRQKRITALLRGVVTVDGVRTRGDSGAELLIERSRSTQRIALEALEGYLVLSTWPSELKGQAVTFYTSDRCERLLELVDSAPDVWRGRPNPHLGFWNARSPLYLSSSFDAGDLSEYIAQWRDDVGRLLHGVDGEVMRTAIWPTLKARGYASDADDKGLTTFIDALGKRKGMVRPGIEVRRYWPWTEAERLDEEGRLSDEIRTAIEEVLTALREPIPTGLNER